VTRRLSRGHRDSVRSTARLIAGNVADDSLLNELFSTSAIHAVMHFAGFAQIEVILEWFRRILGRQ